MMSITLYFVRSYIETDAMIKDMLVHLSKSNLEETIDYIKETYL